VNLFGSEPEYDPEDPEGYRSGVVMASRLAGGSDLVIKYMEIPPGQSICPYHYEYVEEWILVLEGSVVVRVPGDEHQLRRGDLLCFPAGPEGAHKVGNQSQESAQVLMFSSGREPSVAVYPDSDKIGVWPGNPDDHVILRRGDGHVPYYDGEA
jgi:uncharacterized cupin superfamily protein